MYTVLTKKGVRTMHKVSGGTLTYKKNSGKVFLSLGKFRMLLTDLNINFHVMFIAIVKGEKQ